MNNLLTYFKDHTNEILSDVETLVRIESPSKHSEGINRIQDITQAWLSPFGQVSRHPSEFGDILHARIPGQNTNRVVLLAHMDTVYPLGSWTELWQVKGDQAFGPGTYDMKAGTVLAVWALRAIKDLGQVPACTVDLLLTPDE